MLRKGVRECVCGVAALWHAAYSRTHQGCLPRRQTSCVTGAPQGEVCALGSVTPTRFVVQACTPSHALTARCTRVPAAPHAVHVGPLGSYACHTILHTPLPPKVLPACTTPSTSPSCSLTSIMYTALPRPARALLRLCSRCHRKRARRLERGHRARPLAQPDLRHHTHLQQQTHPHDAMLQHHTYLRYLPRHVSPLSLRPPSLP